MKIYWIRIRMDAKVCRICLEKTASICLFNKQNDIELSTMIMRCVNVVIVKGDGYPEHICDKCAGELLVSYEFIDKCEASDKALRCVDLNLESNFPIKEEDIKDEQLDEEDHWDDNISLPSLPSPEPVSVEKKRRKYTKRCVFDRRKLRRKAGPIQCVVCGLITSCRSMMETHMRVHTGEKPFQCHHCEASFKAKGSLKRHIEVRHSVRERKYICEACGSSFYRKNDIIIHMRVHTDERPYVCTFCYRRFRQISSLIRHKKVHTGERPYCCSICNKTFADKNQLKKHSVVHTDERKYTCHLCSKSVKTRNALNTHMKIHSDDKHNICNYCGMAFRMKGNLKLHMTRVHSERSGQCTECHKHFSDIQAHMRKHTGEKPFVCKICNQGFAAQRSLSHHMKFRHENAAKYKCSIGDCTKTFPMATMLEFHLLKQHTNHTPYVCHHCSRGFFRMSDLNRHLRVSHMEGPVKVLTKPVKDN